MGEVPELEDCGNIDFHPMEYNVIVCSQEVEQKTKGGIILTQNTQENEQLAASWGRLVAKSPLAFNYDNWPEGAIQPQVGDEVFYARYAGTILEHEGRKYRVMKDKDIALVRKRVDPSPKMGWADFRAREKEVGTHIATIEMESAQ